MNMLRSIREKKGLTIGQLAARASIPTRVLTEYEEGRQPIPLPHAKLLAKALWVQIEDLLPATGSMTQQSSAAQPATPRIPVQPPTQPQPRPPAPAPAPAPVPVPVPASTTPPYQAHPSNTLPAAQGQSNSGYRSPSTQPPTMPRTDRYSDGGLEGAQAQGLRPGPGGGQPGGRGPESRPARPPRAGSSPSKPISEGQVEELLRLATRLEMEQEKAEEAMGKPVNALTRIEAKEWIKRFRDMADDAVPGGKARFGQWPGPREDREALYLAEQREAGARFHFKLFNNEEFRGTISDFTPYTITIKTGGDSDMVLRKLAIAYYRRLPEGAAEAEVEAKPKRAAKASSAASKKKSEASEQHQPLDDGLDSDRAGEPAAPEADNMDEDRGV